jgi:hypothetical protein
VYCAGVRGAWCVVRACCVLRVAWCLVLGVARGTWSVVLRGELVADVNTFGILSPSKCKFILAVSIPPHLCIIWPSKLKSSE